MTSLDLLRHTYKIISPSHKKELLKLTLSTLLLIFLELGLAGLISLVGISLASPEVLESHFLFKKIMERVSLPGNVPPVISMLMLILLFVTIVTFLKNIITAYTTYTQSYVAQLIAWDAGSYAFRKYLYAPYLWHTTQNTAELQSYLSWRVSVAQVWIGALGVITQLSIMLFLMLGAFIISPFISLALYGICGTLAALTYRSTRKKAQELGTEASNISILANKASHFALQGIREVHIYNQRETFYNQFTMYAPRLAKMSARQSIYPPLPQWILESTGFALLLIAVVFMQWQGESIATITGTLTLMAGISWRLLPSLNKFISATLFIKVNFGASEKLLSSALNLEQNITPTSIVPFNNIIELNKVGFTYPHASKKTLDDISITIKKGSMIGLVGLSGSGKSTLVGVLTGLLPPTEGCFMVDNTTVQAAPGFLKIGYVPQSPYIMDASLAKNVAFSDWGKEIDYDLVQKCCKLASINFLEDLPQGLETVLGDRGVRLSGGQIQRVAIARALYTQPDLLLFDEATSALDGATEASIQQTILSLHKNMTIVMVAHRLSTVQICDEVYWIRDGKIQEKGISKDVLGHYEAFLQKQQNVNNIT